MKKNALKLDERATEEKFTIADIARFASHVSRYRTLSLGASYSDIGRHRIS